MQLDALEVLDKVFGERAVVPRDRLGARGDLVIVPPEDAFQAVEALVGSSSPGLVVGSKRLGCVPREALVGHAHAREAPSQVPPVVPERLVSRVASDEFLVGHALLHPEGEARHQSRVLCTGKNFVIPASFQNEILTSIVELAVGPEGLVHGHHHVLATARLLVLEECGDHGAPLREQLLVRVLLGHEQLAQEELPVGEAARVRDASFAPLVRVPPLLEQRRLVEARRGGQLEEVHRVLTVAPGVAVVGVALRGQGGGSYLSPEKGWDVQGVGVAGQEELDEPPGDAMNNELIIVT